MKKKILFINPRFHTNLFHSIKALNKKYNVAMLVANKQIIEDYSFLKPIILEESVFSKILIKIFLTINKNNRFYFPKFLKLYDFFKKNSPDLIILRNYNKIFGLFVIIISKILGIKLVFYEQLGKSFFKENKFKLLFFSIRNYLLNTKFYTPIYDNFKKNIFFYNFFYVPFLVDIKKKVKKNKGVVKFLFIGKFIPRKNLLFLLKTFSQLNYKNKFKLYIIGEVSSKLHKNYYKLVRKEITNYKINNKIEILKNLKYKKIFKYYRLCDVFIMPSKNEPASISVVESLGQGTPVICENNNGTNFYIKKNYNGLVFHEKNSEDLKKKILFFLKSNKNINKFSNNSYIHFKKNYSEKKYLNQFEKLFK